MKDIVRCSINTLSATLEAYGLTLCDVPLRDFRASDWSQEVWQGSLKIVEKRKEAAILLTDPKDGTETSHFSTYGGIQF